MEEIKGRVCVTGGTGFIGSWIIKTLLEAGYSVNTTVRSHPGHKKDVSFLTNLPGASQRLQILKADLSQPESFKDAIEGCMGVLHVATPVDFEEKEPEEIVTKRPIDGALGILKACLLSQTVKRVVYTSSASAVTNSDKEDEVQDESSWTDVDCLRTSKPSGWSYASSKTLTEKAVLEFGQQHGLDVVTVTPTFVVGPFICPKLPGKDPFSYLQAPVVHVDDVARAHIFLLEHANPKGRYNCSKCLATIEEAPVVHVDDVARAHIFLLEHSNPKGRYNCSKCLATIEEVTKIVSAKYPELQMPTIESLRESTCLKFPDLSSTKLTDAGFEFKCELEEMLVGAIESCKEQGYL